MAEAHLYIENLTSLLHLKIYKAITIKWNTCENLIKKYTYTAYTFSIGVRERERQKIREKD